MTLAFSPWRDRVVLVTGAAGYVGSQLIRDLGSDPAFAGAATRLYDNLQRATYAALMHLPATMSYQMLEGDIMDTTSLRNALRGVDTVIHLAGFVRTPFSFDHPAWTEHVNHWGTARLAELCIEAGVRHLVYTSSTSVYGSGRDCDETTPLNPLGPYAESKMRAEHALQSCAARGMDVTVLRLGTVYGLAPAIRVDAFANRLAYLAARGAALTMHGSGAQQRPVVHVRDASNAIRVAMTDVPGGFQLFNVAAANVTIADTIGAIQSFVPGAAVRTADQHSLTSVSLTVSSAAFRARSWLPQTDLCTGLAEVYQAFGPFAKRAQENSTLPPNE